MRGAAGQRFLLLASGAILAVTSGLGSARAAGPAPAADPLGWRIVATVSQPNTRTVLYSVVTTGAKQAWAVGDAQTAVEPPSDAPVIERWNGTKWTAMTLPAGVLTGLGSQNMITISASGPRNVWTFNLNGHWLHFNGTTWSTSLLPGSSDVWVESSLAASRNSEWAFGGTGSVMLKPYAAYDSGSGWKRTHVPGTGAIVGASEVSDTDIWAVMGTAADGQASPSSGLVHLYGGAWHPGPELPGAMGNIALGSVLARSDASVWVGGGVKNKLGGYTEAVAHWNGHAWSTITFPVPATTGHWHVNSIVPDGSGGLWALGYCMSVCGVHPTRLWHEAGGRWSGPVVPSWETTNTQLSQLAETGHSIWGVGRVRDGGLFDGLIVLRGPVPS